MLVMAGRQLDAVVWKRLMKLSWPLAEQCHRYIRRYRTAGAAPDARHAILMFKGDTYIGFDADTLDEAGLAAAQQHVRILSGLYGLLRPAWRCAP